MRSPLISGNLPLMHNLFVAVTAIDTSNQLGNDVQQMRRRKGKPDSKLALNIETNYTLGEKFTKALMQLAYVVAALLGVERRGFDERLKEAYHEVWTMVSAYLGFSKSCKLTKNLSKRVEQIKKDKEVPKEAAKSKTR